MQRLSPKKIAKRQSKSKRTEKPLLHKVLHTAGFKAQRGAISRANIMRAIPENGDNATEDLDTGIHAETSISRQFFSQKSPLHCTDPNARLKTSWEVKDTKDGHPTKVEVDAVNIGGLEIMDCPLMDN